MIGIQSELFVPIQNKNENVSATAKTVTGKKRTGKKHIGKKRTGKKRICI